MGHGSAFGQSDIDDFVPEAAYVQRGVIVIAVVVVGNIDMGDVALLVKFRPPKWSSHGWNEHFPD